MDRCVPKISDLGVPRKSEVCVPVISDLGVPSVEKFARSTIKGQLGLLAAKSVRDQIMAEHQLKTKLASQLDTALGHA